MKSSQLSPPTLNEYRASLVSRVIEEECYGLIIEGENLILDPEIAPEKTFNKYFKNIEIPIEEFLDELIKEKIIWITIHIFIPDDLNETAHITYLNYQINVSGFLCKQIEGKFIENSIFGSSYHDGSKYDTKITTYEDFVESYNVIKNMIEFCESTKKIDDLGFFEI